ncbi:MAG: DUF928 domain-containing protein [Cyanobacteria bacterium J06581_3]
MSRVLGKATGVTIAATLVGLFIVPFSPAMAQVSVQSSVQFVPTPPDQGAPDGRQRGGATRGDCVTYQDLVAIVPRVENVVWSQTTSATPTFFFDVLADLTEEIPLEFVIQDANDEYVFQQQFEVNAEAGLLAVPTMSETAENAGLALDESYQWTFSIYCDEDRPSAAVSVSGTVQRVADGSAGPISDDELTPDKQFERLQQYAAAGIWHEAIEIAITLHQAEPNNVTYQETLASLFMQAGISETLPAEAPTAGSIPVEEKREEIPPAESPSDSSLVSPMGDVL